jgi:hypothetical protein
LATKIAAIWTPEYFLPLKFLFAEDPLSINRQLIICPEVTNAATAQTKIQLF